MKNIKKVKEIIKRNKDILEQEYKVKLIGIFGSYVTGEPKTKSDIDILVEFSETPDIFNFIKLEEFLSNLLGIKVDLVSKKALKPLIKNKVLKEAVYA